MTRKMTLLTLAFAALVLTHSCGDGGQTEPPQQNRSPLASGAIPSAKIFVGDTLRVDLSQYFNDPDGDALTYAATVSDARVLAVGVAGATLSATALARGEVQVTVTAQDPDGLTAQQTFTVTVPNRAPVTTAVLPASELFVGDTFTVDLSAYFDDPDGETLDYAAQSSATEVAAVTVEGSTLTLAAKAPGVAEVTVTASDPGDLSVQQIFDVTVPNRAPVVTAELPAVELVVRDRVTVDLSAHFEDPDGDTLDYAAESSKAGIAEVTVDGGELAIVGQGRGEAVVTVTASDQGGLSVRQDFAVTVNPRAGYLHLDFQYDQSDMGGLAVQLDGPVIDSVRVAPGLSVHASPTEGGMRVILLGPIPSSGTLLTFWTDDIDRLDEYDVLPIQLAARTYELLSLEGFRMRLRREL